MADCHNYYWCLLGSYLFILQALVFFSHRQNKCSMWKLVTSLLEKGARKGSGHVFVVTSNVHRLTLWPFTLRCMKRNKHTMAPSDQESLGFSTSSNNILWLFLYGYRESHLLLESKSFGRVVRLGAAAATLTNICRTVLHSWLAALRDRP